MLHRLTSYELTEWMEFLRLEAEEQDKAEKARARAEQVKGW